MIITLDGPAGVGKSTICRSLAQALNFTYIDTGAMFRAIAWAAQQRGIDCFDHAALDHLIPQLTLEFCRIDDEDQLFLNGQNVEPHIRTPEIGMAASQIAKNPAVRQHLLNLQRQLAQQGNSIFEGRDTGTVVFPDADLKFFLEASTEIRTLRRLKQMSEDQNHTQHDFAQLQRQIEARDLQDTKRDIAPLCRAPDAILIDTSNLSFQEVLQNLLRIIHAQQKNLDE
jgi:cytidylate kinase